jgi:hypothetical protein
MEAFQRATAATNPLVHLVGNFERAIGFVYSLDFEIAKILTNDHWKDRVAGVPLNAFLVAAAFDPDKFDAAMEIDRQVILLRVIGPTTLPMSGDNLKAMVEHYQRKTHMSRTRGDLQAFDVEDGFDAYTRAELQFGGLEARILGTFFMDDGELHLGADIENFAAASSLRVYKPTDSALKRIVNFVDPIRLAKAVDDARTQGFGEMPAPFPIGSVRYASTDRLHRRQAKSDVPVEIHPSDFLARRTAVFGMTRTGKSNSVKTMVSAVGLAGLRQEVSIGQVIFDINGEYANANNQDQGSSIAEVFSDQTIRYRGLTTPGFEDLRNNFYESPQIGLTILQQLLKVDWKAPGADVQAFFGASLEEPDQAIQRGDWERWRRHVACFQAILAAAHYPAPLNLRVRFSAAVEVRDLIYETTSPDHNENDSTREHNTKRDAYCPNPDEGLTLDQARDWFARARDANRRLEQREHERIVKKEPAPRGHRPCLARSASAEPWFDPTLRALVNLLVQKNENDATIRGASLLASYREYHSAQRRGNVESEIYGHLAAGRIVILDLSVGTMLVRTTMAERIAEHIFLASMSAFHAGRRPPNVVMYVEEAHNLIGKSAELDTTWPRIAKEGAKAQIAFVYATQEPSSIHPNIMANTENWFVTHLNNDDELKALGKFYDFADFAPSLKRAQDVGFARVKTLSSPFVVPMQIDRFNPETLKAQLSAGRRRQ